MDKDNSFNIAFLNFLKNRELINKNDRVLLAVSGGVDSVVMCELFFTNRIPFDIAHVNFTLRGSDSDKDEEFVGSLAEKYGSFFHKKSFDTKSFAITNKISIEMAARQLRYSWFEELAQKHKYSKIGLAHHQNDHLETLLLNIAKGSALKGIRGILPKRGIFIRPLMFAKKEMIIDFAKVTQLNYREDVTNEDISFQRNLIRSKVVPLLKKINPEIESTVFRNTSLFIDYEKIVDEEFERARKEIIQIKDGKLLFKIMGLKSYPHKKTFLFKELNPYGFTNKQIDKVDDLILSQSGRKIKSGQFELIHSREFLVLQKIKIFASVYYEVSEYLSELKTESGIYTFTLINNYPDQNDLINPRNAFLDHSKIKFPIIVRTWTKGDYFYPFGEKMRKKISDFLTEIKVDANNKKNIQVVLSSGEIIWVSGFRVDNRYRLNKNTTKILKITFNPYI